MVVVKADVAQGAYGGVMGDSEETRSLSDASSSSGSTRVSSLSKAEGEDEKAGFKG